MDLAELNIPNGVGWSVIWILIVLFLGRRPFPQALLSGLVFFVWWCIISVILYVICKGTGYCL